MILIEGRTPSNQPLVLSVWDANNNEVTEISMPMSLGARILLLLHGMNSDTTTWTNFVNSTFAGAAVDIFQGNTSTPNTQPPEISQKMESAVTGFSLALMLQQYWSTHWL